MTDSSRPAGGEAVASFLDLEGVDVRYGRIPAVKGVSLTVGDGEMVALVGANGAGKSTLMRAIAGLEPVAAGAVRFRGRDLAVVPAHKRVGLGIALVQEGRSVFAPLTVRENLRLGMLPLGLFTSAADFEARMEEVLALFPVLRKRPGVRAGELSGGQQQMLAIARALMARPALLLLDEPSLGLAPVIVEELFIKLVELNERAGLSVVLAEQNIDNALAIADRAYVFEVGRVVLTGPAAELRQRPEVEDVYLGRSTHPTDT